MYHGSLYDGLGSVVYYKNGTIKVGEWGRDFKMSPKIEGVRQNLKLLVDHGKAASDANLSVQSNWGATLGGGAWVWRSGIGITKDGRIVYVYRRRSTRGTSRCCSSGPARSRACSSTSIRPG